MKLSLNGRKPENYSLLRKTPQIVINPDYRKKDDKKKIYNPCSFKPGLLLSVVVMEKI